MTTLQYITIGAATAAAERLTGRPVAAPVPAQATRVDPRTTPRARPVPRAVAVALPEALGADPIVSVAVPAAVVVVGGQPGNEDSQHRSAGQAPLDSGAQAQPAAAPESSSSRSLPLPVSQPIQVGVRKALGWELDKT